MQNLNINQARTAYPDLMAFIEKYSPSGSSDEWVPALTEENRKAMHQMDASLHLVATQVRQVEADYAKEASKKGPQYSTYPYNASLLAFLGLTEEKHGTGLYMARQVCSHWEYGVYRREVEALLAAGKTLKVATAFSKKTGKAVRTTTFTPDQIHLYQWGEPSGYAKNDRYRVNIWDNSTLTSAFRRLKLALTEGYLWHETSGK